MSDQTNRHPYLEGLKDASVHQNVLWSTGIPVYGLLEHDPEFETVTDHPSIDLKTHDTTSGPSDQTTVQDEMLSPFAKWLTGLKPSARYGQFQQPPDIPLISSVKDVPSVEVAAPRKKKKKDKKKRKKEKKQTKATKIQPDIPSLGKDIASDTLAELIVNQGHIDEAIAMYQKLITLHPERAEFYSARIDQLRQRPPAQG